MATGIPKEIANALIERVRALAVQEAVDRLATSLHHSEACGHGATLEREEEYDCICGLWEALEQLKEEYGITYIDRYRNT